MSWNNEGNANNVAELLEVHKSEMYSMRLHIIDLTTKLEETNKRILQLESLVENTDKNEPSSHNVSKYANFNKTCSSVNQNTSDLHTRMKKKWDDKLQEKNLMKVDNKDRKPTCDSYDSKKTYVNSGTNTTGRVNFLTGKGKRKKYLGSAVYRSKIVLTEVRHLKQIYLLVCL